MKKIISILLLIFGCSTSPEDCTGTSGGEAAIDNCGICAGGTTNIIPNYLEDCAGVCGGDAINLQCCGNTEWSSDCTDCGIEKSDTECDCAGTLPSITNNCCSNNLGPNGEIQDCAGVCGGQASQVGQNMNYISSGDGYSMAITSFGDVVAWGNNESDQTNIPTDLNNIIEISAATDHSLALTSSGDVVAWGKNNHGQSDVPLDLNNVIAISAGYWHSLALTSSGTVVAWGRNNYGQSDVPLGLNNVIAISAGYWHSLALTSSGDVVAWGRNNFNQIDLPSDLNNVIAISAGYWFSLALTSSGNVIAWGYNGFGCTNVPANLKNVVAIDAGNLNALALTSFGEIIIWGKNDNQIYLDVEEVNESNSFIAMSMGYYHGFLLNNIGKIISIGENSFNTSNHNNKFEIVCN